MKFRCVQPGHECEFEAASAPTHCPVCRYPFAGKAIGESEAAAGDELPWSDYGIDELREYAESWGVEGWDKRTSKASLITLLTAAEQEAEAA